MSKQLFTERTRLKALCDAIKRKDFTLATELADNCKIIDSAKHLNSCLMCGHTADGDHETIGQLREHLALMADRLQVAKGQRYSDDGCN